MWLKVHSDLELLFSKEYCLRLPSKDFFLPSKGRPSWTYSWFWQTSSCLRHTQGSDMPLFISLWQQRCTEWMKVGLDLTILLYGNNNGSEYGSIKGLCPSERPQKVRMWYAVFKTNEKSNWETFSCKHKRGDYRSLGEGREQREMDNSF